VFLFREESSKAMVKIDIRRFALFLPKLKRIIVICEEEGGEKQPIKSVFASNRSDRVLHSL
jgi:hypothetical protein